MPRFHILSTTTNEGQTVASSVPITRLDVAQARANAAGNPSLCKSQTIEVREGVPTDYRVVGEHARFSDGSMWGEWIHALEILV